MHSTCQMYSMLPKCKLIKIGQLILQMNKCQWKVYFVCQNHTTKAMYVFWQTFHEHYPISTCFCLDKATERIISLFSLALYWSSCKSHGQNNIVLSLATSVFHIRSGQFQLITAQFYRNWKSAGVSASCSSKPTNQPAANQTGRVNAHYFVLITLGCRYPISAHTPSTQHRSNNIWNILRPAWGWRVHRLQRPQDTGRRPMMTSA